MPTPKKPAAKRPAKPAAKPKPKPVDIHNEGQLRAARKKNIRLAKRFERLAHLRRKWAATRDRQLKRLQARKDPRAKAVKFLHDRLGSHEDPGRPNRAPFLDRWVRDYGQAWMTGQPWCGLAVWRAAREAGVHLDPTTVSTVAIRDMARRGVGGFKAWHDRGTYTPHPGDVAIYGTGSPQHTGMYAGNGIVYEGNTSPGHGGSQNDGGGLYPRTLAERGNWLLGWAVIDWSKR